MEFIYKSILSPADIEQIEAFYDSLELAQIEQHPFWHMNIEVKTVKYFIAYEKGKIVCYSVLFEKKAGPVGFANIRFGPLFKEPKHLIDSLIEIADHYKKRHFLFISIQLVLFTGAVADLVEAKFYQAHKFKNSFDRHNWSSIIIRLDQDEELILKNFAPRHRQSIKKFLKANAKVRLAESKADILAFAQVFYKMESSRNISSESKEEIEDQFIRIFDFFRNKNKGLIMVVTDEAGTIIGGTINIFQGKGVRYFKGAADPEKRDIPVLHAAFFETMKIVRGMGYQYLDLWGYNHYVDKNDQIYNINQFKKGFGGEFVFYPKLMHVQLVPFGRFIYETMMKLMKIAKRIRRS